GPAALPGCQSRSAMLDSALPISARNSSASSASCRLTWLISVSVQGRSPARTGKPAASDCAAAVIPRLPWRRTDDDLGCEASPEDKCCRGDSQTGPTPTLRAPRAAAWVRLRRKNRPCRELPLTAARRRVQGKRARSAGTERLVRRKGTYAAQVIRDAHGGFGDGPRATGLSRHRARRAQPVGAGQGTEPIAD